MTPRELRDHRIANGYTQRQLAALLGVNHRTLGRWELGQVKIPPIAQRYLEKLFEIPKK